MPTEGILTLLIIVVSVLAVAMLGVIAFLTISNRRNRGPAGRNTARFRRSFRTVSLISERRLF